MGRTVSTAAVIAVTVVMLLAGPVGLVSAQKVTLTVSVVDQDGEPVQNAEITASWEGDDSTAVTRSNGQALIDVEQGADVTITVEHDAYTRNFPYEITDASAGEVTIDVAEKAEASVTVRDATGPIKDARVALRKDGRAVAVGLTDANGRFASGIIEAGDYSVAVLEQGYYQKTMDVEIRGETTKEVELEPGTVSVTFNVLDRNFDPPRPVSGATISGDAIGSMRTQQNGVQQASVPVNTEIEVTVTKDGYKQVEQTIKLGETDTEINISTRKEETISFEFLNDRVVAGEQVLVEVTGTYGDPVEEANVYLDGTQVGTTDTNGVVTVTIDSPGEHTLHAESGTLSTAQRTVVGVEAAADQEMTTPTGQAAQAGLMAVPGLGQQIHPKSLGIGLAVGVVLMLVLIGYGRFRSMSSGE